MFFFLECGFPERYWTECGGAWPGGMLSLRRLWRAVWIIIPEYRRNSAAYIHTFVTYCLPPHTTFFSHLIATFPFLGLYLSQMVHLIPYDIDPLWALFHSRPWRASVCPIVHLGCVLRAVHQTGDELGGAHPMTPLDGPCCGSHPALHQQSQRQVQAVWSMGSFSRTVYTKANYPFPLAPAARRGLQEAFPGVTRIGAPPNVMVCH